MEKNPLPTKEGKTTMEALSSLYIRLKCAGKDIYKIKVKKLSARLISNDRTLTTNTNIIN